MVSLYLWKPGWIFPRDMQSKRYRTGYSCTNWTLYSPWSPCSQYRGDMLLLLQTQVLSVEQVDKPCIRLIQENPIENSVQDCLPYILKLHGPWWLLLVYPKQPCVCLEIIMCLNMPSDIILSESSTLFHVIHNCDFCHVTGVIQWCHLNPNPKSPKIKIKKKRNDK